MNPLISVSELLRLKSQQEKFCLLDARFRIADSTVAERLFADGHIPDALRVDLDRDLSGVKTGRNGRHPFPAPEVLAKFFSHLGISDSTRVVAYDDADHAGAARLWFLLRWLGHEKVQVLNGGLKAWAAEGHSLETEKALLPESKEFTVRPSLVAISAREALVPPLVDVRAPERYRGEVEPLDAIAGHIPRAKNLPYASLLGADGKFLPKLELAAKLASVGNSPTFYCGSGVTACVAMLAAEQVGFRASLYPGSWSEWSSLPGAAVEVG